MTQPKPSLLVSPNDTSESAWSRTIVRGVRANDLSGKAGEVAGELEDRLVRGHYRFGDALSIYNLAKEFGASRQPVSSAVLYLGTIGYLDIIPQVGCRVVSPSPQDVDDFNRLFARTESLIARCAAERYAEDEGEELVSMARDLAQNTFSTRRDRRLMADGISVFHDFMSGMARSPVMVDRISNLRRIFRFYLSQGRKSADRLTAPPKEMNRRRVKLAEAIKSRQSTEAEILMEEYILLCLAEWTRVV